MRRLVLRVDLEAPAKRAGGFRHVSAVVVRDPEIVIRDDEPRRRRDRLLIPLDREIEGPLMEVDRSEKMVRDHVIRIDLDESLELAPRFLALSVLLENERGEQALIHPRIPKEHPALGAVLLLLGRCLPAAGTAFDRLGSHRIPSSPVELTGPASRRAPSDRSCAPDRPEAPA